MLKKIWFLLFFGICAGCRSSSLDAEIYNNQIISFQEQGVQALIDYHAQLGKDIDKEPLSSKYFSLVKKLEELQKEVDQVPLWKEDSQLQDAVAMYLSGLVFALEQYERPIIGYLTAFSGNQLQEIAQRRGHISQLSMQFAHELAKLDKQLERSRKQFAEQYALSGSSFSVVSPVSGSDKT